MKKWLLSSAIGVILAVTVGLAFRSRIKSEAKKKREDVYESTLRGYSQNLKPGLTLKEVEEYLRTKGSAFTQMCCMNERSTLADLVKIGEEDAPWYCSKHWVHIAFDFASTEAHNGLKATTPMC